MQNVEVLKEFIFDCKLRKLSVRTVKSYHNNTLKFCNFVEGEYQTTELEETYPNMVRGYINYLTTQKLTESYVNTIVKSLRAYFKYCVEEGYISRSPMEKIKFQKEPLTLINTFNDAEVYRMVTYFKGSKFLAIRNRLIMTILFDSGMRNSELCELKLSDIRDTYIHIMGKGNKERHVPITLAINKVLIKYLRIRSEYVKHKPLYEIEYLLLSQKGRRLTVESLERIVATCGVGCNVRPEIRVSPHTCRHYYAQTQLKNGCDLFTVSKLLGHSNINITKRYLNSIHDDTLMEMGAKTSPLNHLRS